MARFDLGVKFRFCPLCEIISGVNPSHVEGSRAKHRVEIISRSVDDVAEFMTNVTSFDKLFRFLLHGGLIESLCHDSMAQRSSTNMCATYTLMCLSDDVLGFFRGYSSLVGARE